jgi:hypothetical protein
MASLLLATRWGVGITPDAIVYVTSARNLADGYGLVLAVDGLAYTPVTHHAPFYPFLLGSLGVVGIAPVVIARWLNTLLFAANILLVVLLGAVNSKQYSVNSEPDQADDRLPLTGHRSPIAIWLPLVGGLLLLPAPMLEVHAYALTEPLFLLLLLAALWLLTAYLETAAPRYLLLTAVLLALACLTRYAGLAFVLAAGLALLLWDAGPLRQRLGRALLLGAVAGLPLALWLIRNQVVAGTGTSRSLVFHPLGPGHVRQAVDTVSSWLLLPLTLPGLVKMGLLAVLLAGGVGLAWRVYGRSWPPLLKLLSLFSLVYLLFLVISISFVDANTPLDHRILAPIYLMGVVGGVGLLTAVYAHRLSSPFMRTIGALFLLLFLVGQGVQTAGWLQQAYRDGLGFNQRVWRQSALLAEVRTLPAGVPIYSNAPSAVHFLIGRPVQALPRKMEATTQQSNPHYPAEMAALQSQFQEETAVVVYLTVLAGAAAPTEPELQEVLALHPQTRLPEGVLYVTR